MAKRSAAQRAATAKMLASNASRRRGGCGCGAKAAAPRRGKVRRIILKPGQRIRIPTTGRYL
jgi:hypothetical protein